MTDKLQKSENTTELTQVLLDKLKAVGLENIRVGSRIWRDYARVITKITKEGLYHESKYSNGKKYENCITWEDLGSS